MLQWKDELAFLAQPAHVDSELEISRPRFSVVHQIFKSNHFPTLEEYRIAYLERV